MQITVLELRRKITLKHHTSALILGTGDLVKASKIMDDVKFLEDIVMLAEILGTDTVEIQNEV